MTALEIKKELSDFIENGTIVTTIYDIFIKYFKEKVNPVPCVLAEMHNNCEIDLNKIFIKITKTESKHNFFNLFLAYSKALPMLNSSVDDVIPCVHHLLEQEENNFHSMELNTAFVKYCKENIDRPKEALAFIFNHTDEYYYLISSTIASSDKYELSEWAASQVELLINHESIELQRQGYIAINYIPLVAKQYIDLFYSLIEESLDKELDNKLQAEVLRAIVALAKIDTKLLNRAEGLLKQIIRFSEPDLFYAASRLVAYEKEELPHAIFTLLIEYLKNAPGEYPGIADNIDFTLVNLLQDGNEASTEALLSSLLCNGKKFNIMSFQYFFHDILQNHQYFVNIIVTKWFLSGDGHLCRAIHDLFSLHAYKETRLCACLEYIDNFDFKILYIARKAIGWISFFPIPATTFILSMYKHTTLEIQNELENLLFEQLLLNYPSIVAELLNSLANKEEYKGLVNNLLTKYNEYYKGIESVCKIKELRSPSENRISYMKCFNKSMCKAYEEAKSPLLKQLCTEHTLLYGDSSIHYISNHMGDKHRSEIQMETISHSMEVPMLPIVDYVGTTINYNAFVMRGRKMKLILKQYLSALKERSELDAILPDLLSQMGLNVFISPHRGVKEYGVDIAAVGKIDGDIEKVYLFSVKSGNLTRSTWAGNTDQALRPSLNEIQDAFIPARIPPEHRQKPVVICLCFGGDVSSGIRQDVTGYQQNHTGGLVSFEEWNGDRLANLILEHLLKEELLPKNWQSMLRKSLALLDEVRASHSHFKTLVQTVFDCTTGTHSEYKSLTTINLCLWVLFSWCRDGNNLESAYLSAEFALLHAWEKVKNCEDAKAKGAFEKLLYTYQVITDEYINKCLLPFVESKYAISRAINSRCDIDVNIRLFELLGCLAMKGAWILDQLTQSLRTSPVEDEENADQIVLREKLNSINAAIKHFITNNPLLLSPYKDSQTIDIGLAIYLLSQDSEHDKFVVNWLQKIIKRSIFSYVANGLPPTTLDKYEELLHFRHNKENDKKYIHKITRASVLYPLLALYCGLYKVEQVGKELEDFTNKELGHCTLQYWYPNHNTEKFLYSNTRVHGSAQTSFPMNSVDAVRCVRDECAQSNFFGELSAIKKGYLPLVLLACRHYRYPIPFAVLDDFLNEAE